MVETELARGRAAISRGGGERLGGAVGHRDRRGRGVPVENRRSRAGASTRAQVQALRQTAGRHGQHGRPAGRYGGDEVLVDPVEQVHLRVQRGHRRSRSHGDRYRVEHVDRRVGVFQRERHREVQNDQLRTRRRLHRALTVWARAGPAVRASDARVPVAATSHRRRLKSADAARTDLFEKVYIGLFDDDGSVRFFDVEQAPPRNQPPVDTITLAQLIQTMRVAVAVRNEGVAPEDRYALDNPTWSAPPLPEGIEMEAPLDDVSSLEEGEEEEDS